VEEGKLRVLEKRALRRMFGTKVDEEMMIKTS
jgi:hypothetical protein